jgi:hypothetical protein
MTIGAFLTGTLTLVSFLLLIAGLPHLVGYAKEALSWLAQRASAGELTLVGGSVFGCSLASMALEVRRRSDMRPGIAAASFWSVIVGFTLVVSASELPLLKEPILTVRNGATGHHHDQGAFVQKPKSRPVDLAPSSERPATVVPATNHATASEAAPVEAPPAREAPSASPPAVAREPIETVPVRQQVATETRTETSSRSETTSKTETTSEETGGSASAEATGSASSESSAEAVGR